MARTVARGDTNVVLCRVISAQQHAEVLQALESTPYQVTILQSQYAEHPSSLSSSAESTSTFLQVTAGGSLSNTLIGLSRLGQADNCLRGSGGLQVALAGAVGSDTLGSFFAARAAKAGVQILADTVADSCTGTTCKLARHGFQAAGGGKRPLPPLGPP